MKNIVKGILMVSILTFGVSTTAHAQILDALRKTAEAVKSVNSAVRDTRETYQNNSYNQTREETPSYSRIGSVSLISWNQSGSMKSTTRASADVVVNDSGEKLIKKGSSTYSIRENGSYSSYSGDSGDPSYYEYYVYMDGKKYYFNL